MTLFGWEKVILRNYALVPSEKIAKAIHTTPEEVECFAAKIGLDRYQFDPIWREKGFVTIIRNNWDILPNQMIADLLDYSREEFETLLKEYDFLDVKLGAKPAFDPPVYNDPPADHKKLQKLKELIEDTYTPRTVLPFDFYRGEVVRCEETDFAIGDRFVSAYSARYTGALLDDELVDYSEEYLRRLSDTGVNGIWLSETLRALAPFPFDESYSPDFSVRIRNLKKLVERCKSFGIGIYLYLNEPRSLPSSFFEKYSALRGHKVGENEYCLCTSNREVQQYLYDAVKFVVSSVPDLKGIFTITMSENPTNCYYAYGKATDCPVCSKRKAYEVVAELNNLLCRAVKAGSKTTEYIANIWGWAEYMGWEKGDECKGIELLDPEVDVMCVSEFDKLFTRGGVSSNIIDYSISVIGPGEYAERCLQYAKERGHNVWAKIQVNNSWELSAVPYLPVFDMMTDHIENLKKLGVKGLMMGWSLGGYPGGGLAACSMACGKGKFSLASYVKKVYGEDAEKVLAAMRCFREGFEEYPFSLSSLYNGAQTLGPANLWSLYADGRKSTMVCFSFDDDEVWASPYGLGTYTRQYGKLCEKWHMGLEILSSVHGNALVEELKIVAGAAYAHFFSAFKHAEFVALKKDLIGNKEGIEKVLHEEYENTKTLIALSAQDARIGFEITNHYNYTQVTLIEKLWNLQSMLFELKALRG